MAPPRKPVLCRAHLHHRWEFVRTPDGARYERCARCFRERSDGISADTKAFMGFGGI